jgi:phosphatidylserine decarboxylase
MDSSNAIEISSANTPEDIGLNRSPTRGILKKSCTIGIKRFGHVNKASIRRTSTANLENSRKVTFMDKNKNIPICTVFEVEPIRYDDNDSPKGKSCACLII